MSPASRTQEVARDDLGRGDDRNFSIAHNPGPRGGHRTESQDGTVGAALLEEANTPFRATMAAMAIASSRSAATVAIAQAPISSQMSGLLNCRARTIHVDARRSPRISFRPCSTSRRAASALESPGEPRSQQSGWEPRHTCQNRQDARAYGAGRC